MRFPRQEYWSGLPVPSPRDLTDPGIKPMSPAWQVDSLPLSHLGHPYYILDNLHYIWGVDSTLLIFTNMETSSESFTKFLFLHQGPLLGLEQALITPSSTLFPWPSVVIHGYSCRSRNTLAFYTEPRLCSYQLLQCSQIPQRHKSRLQPQPKFLQSHKA